MRRPSRQSNAGSDTTSTTRPSRCDWPIVGYVIEMTPVIGGTADHGAVADGAVGSPFLGRANLFGYEVRAWRDGMIPDVNEAASRRDAGMTVERS